MEESQHPEAQISSKDLLQDPRCAQVMACICYAFFAYMSGFLGIMWHAECIHNTIYNNENEIFTLPKYANGPQVQYHVSTTA